MPRTRNLCVKHHRASEVIASDATGTGVIRWDDLGDLAIDVAAGRWSAPTVDGVRGIAVVSLVAALLGAAVARGQSEGALRGRIAHGKAQEQRLTGAVAR